MSIAVYAGQLGNGKTLGMVAKALRILKNNPNLTVYANFEFWWYDFKGNKVYASKLTSWAQLNSLENCLVLLDEGHILFDSRDFKNNIEKTHFVLQSRHVGLNILITTQVLDQIDNRIRRIIDKLVICEKKKNRQGERYFAYHHLTPSSLSTDTFNIGRSEYLTKPHLVWNHYDTLEIVTDLVGLKSNSKRTYGKPTGTFLPFKNLVTTLKAPVRATYPLGMKPSDLLDAYGLPTRKLV